jgi:hypothetical protein
LEQHLCPGQCPGMSLEVLAATPTQLPQAI